MKTDSPLSPNCPNPHLLIGFDNSGFVVGLILLGYNLAAFPQ